MYIIIKTYSLLGRTAKQLAVGKGHQVVAGFLQYSSLEKKEGKQFVI